MNINQLNISALVNALELFVLSDLERCRDNLAADLRRAKANKDKAPNVFSMDRKEDAEILAKHVAAFDIVIKYYGG
jgi:glutathione synthase/RimK-type ligase-like ATP-grasp enzyme